MFASKHYFYDRYTFFPVSIDVGKAILIKITRYEKKSCLHYIQPVNCKQTLKNEEYRMHICTTVPVFRGKDLITFFQ